MTQTAPTYLRYDQICATKAQDRHHQDVFPPAVSCERRGAAWVSHSGAELSAVHSKTQSTFIDIYIYIYIKQTLPTPHIRKSNNRKNRNTNETLFSSVHKDIEEQQQHVSFLFVRSNIHVVCKCKLTRTVTAGDEEQPERSHDRVLHVQTESCTRSSLRATKERRTGGERHGQRARGSVKAPETEPSMLLHTVC